jgi:hypothetical protein
MTILSIIQDFQELFQIFLFVKFESSSNFSKQNSSQFTVFYRGQLQISLIWLVRMNNKHGEFEQSVAGLFAKKR